MRSFDENIQPVLGVPLGTGRGVDHGRLVLHLHRQVQDIFPSVVAHPESGLKIGRVYRAGPDPGQADGIPSHALRPIAQVTVDGDSLQRYGDGHCAVVGVRRERESEEEQERGDSPGNEINRG